MRTAFTAFTEGDLALLHALQIAPRASWADLAEVLGGNPGVLATRWHRLRAAGLAWMTVYPTMPRADIVSALVEIELDPAHRVTTIAALCQDPRAATIEETSAGRDLRITAFVADHEALSALVLDDLPRLPGVRRIATHLVTGIHAEGTRWRLDALDRAQQAAAHALVARKRNPRSHIPAHCLPLVAALARDGRASAAELARATGRNPATVRRQLAHLLAADILAFRCEIAQVQSRWPVSCTWFAHVAANELHKTVRTLRTLPELRMCLSISGAANLMVGVWAHSAGELNLLEQRMNEVLPRLKLLESMLTLRMHKRMGWLLDNHGHSSGRLVGSDVFWQHPGVEDTSQPGCPGL